MFEFLSWGHVVVIALAALFIFGPERLPTLAADSARGLKRARAMLDSVRGELSDALGDDFADLRTLDVRRYHPRVLLREQLFAEEANVSTGQFAGSSAAGAPIPARRRDDLPPPFDVDAT